FTHCSVPTLRRPVQLPGSCITRSNEANSSLSNGNRLQAFCPKAPLREKSNHDLSRSCWSLAEQSLMTQAIEVPLRSRLSGLMVIVNQVHRLLRLTKGHREPRSPGRKGWLG